jgi:hypothetical protein
MMHKTRSRLDNRLDQPMVPFAGEFRTLFFRDNDRFAHKARRSMGTYTARLGWVFGSSNEKEKKIS